MDQVQAFCSNCGQPQRKSPGSRISAPAESIDLTSTVSDVRKFRGCSSIPAIVAFCVIGSTPLTLFTGRRDWPAFATMLVSAAGLLLLARLVARGSVWAISILTLLTWSFPFALLWGLVIEPPPRDSIGSIVCLVFVAALLCWSTAKGLPASIRYRRFSAGLIKPPKCPKTRPIPKDRRLLQAMKPFLQALFIYIAAVPAALIASAVFPVHGVIGRFVFQPLAGLASRVYLYARQLTLLHVTEIRKLDGRKPVLFIRSFSDDDVKLSRKLGLGRMLAPDTLTLEEFLVDRSWSVGPVLAIGKPGEELSPVGAAREYLSADSWRERIQDLLRESQLFVSVLGTTRGLMWEYEAIARFRAASKLLVVFPPASLPLAYHRWEMFRTAFSEAGHLPALGKRRPLIAAFDCQGRPLLLVCRYQTESAYNLAFDVAFTHLKSHSSFAFKSA